MDERSHIRPLDLPVSPEEAVGAWPRTVPLLALHTGREHERWGRWTILAAPAGWYRVSAHAGATATGLDDALAAELTGDDPLADLDLLLEATRCGPETCDTQNGVNFPFRGGWIGFLSHDLGRIIEPAAQIRNGAADDRDWPVMELARCPDAFVFDHKRRQWFTVGSRDALQGCIESIRRGATEPTPGFQCGPLKPQQTAEAHEAAVARTVEYIAAGDIFQANITQRWTCAFAGSTRRLWQRAMRRSEARYGAYLELPRGRAIVSMSPELFLELDGASRRIATRPIKGTRPSTAPVRELVESSKDAAELHMIIDLMRNDLGRVCEFGSVRVTSARTIETHPTVHHGVGEVIGRVRSGVSRGDVLRASFPGGSVTGAPKIRAMQIIDELEPVRRGPYCGAIGFFDSGGGMTLNIAIRTMLLHGQRDETRPDALTGTLDYSAGGGIVADSEPRAEYAESLDKAAVLRLVLAEDDGAHETVPGAPEPETVVSR